jgi:protein tyrosine phosphatase (PTP) superfamily phosphohydrolase (DUF442 family)
MKTAAKVIASVVVTLLLVLALPVYTYFLQHNFRTVDEGDFYGSRQMSGAALEEAIQEYGVLTVVNLRGKNPGTQWYDEEIAVCRRLNVAHEDFGWSKNTLPDPASLAKFVELMETGKRPFLAHCEGGTHRTGVAAACYLLCEGADTATARKQFGPMFDDAPIGKVIDLYEGSGMEFPRWVKEVYPAQYESVKPKQASSLQINCFTLACSAR